MSKPIRCPGIACGGSMYPERRHGVTADRCDRCGGLWFDAEELDGWLGDTVAPESRIPERGIGSRPCPRCEHPLDTAGWTGLVLDRCPTCRGLFVEANEIVRMQKEELPAEGVPFELRFAEVMVNMGWTALAASGLARILLLFLRR